MAWSTREIAELAGTSLRAVRHYHEIGLLEEPGRHANGYKQYGVTHLVRVLRIKRLSDLGLSLAQVAAMGDVQDHPTDALRPIDAELAATIKGLQRARVELGLILHQAEPTDHPSDTALAEAEAQNLPADPAASDFDHLLANAGVPTRQNIAERLVPYVRALHAEHPEMQNANADAPRGSGLAEQPADKAINDVYNPA